MFDLRKTNRDLFWAMCILAATQAAEGLGFIFDVGKIATLPSESFFQVFSLFSPLAIGSSLLISASVFLYGSIRGDYRLLRLSMWFGAIYTAVFILAFVSTALGGGVTSPTAISKWGGIFTCVHLVATSSPVCTH